MVWIALTCIVAVATLAAGGIALVRGPSSTPAADSLTGGAGVASSSEPGTSSGTAPAPTPTTPSATAPTPTAPTPTAPTPVEPSPTSAGSTGENVVGPSTPPKPAAPVRVVFLGDGVASSDTAAGRADWTAQTSAALDAAGAPVQRATVADDGAGYVSRSSSGRVFSELAFTAVTPSTGVVVLMGSRNDLDQASAVQDTATVTLAAIRARSPGASVVVIAPLPVSGDSPATASDLATVREGLRAAADASGATFVDPVAAGWALGADATSSGTDQLQLTPSGQAHVAQEVAASVRPLVAAAGASPAP